MPPLPAQSGVLYSPVGHDYRPTAIVPAGIIPFPVDGIYLENVIGAQLSDVSLLFNPLGGGGGVAPPYGDCINGTSNSLASLNATGTQCRSSVVVSVPLPLPPSFA